MEVIYTIIFMAAGGAATVFLAPVVVTILGFTATGIVAHSLAAKLMSYFAVLYGGGVPAGGLVAFFQSLGASGLSWLGTAILAGIGGALGWILSLI